MNGSDPSAGDQPSPLPTPRRFQADPDVRWRLFLRSEPHTVYRALATAEGRSRYWAEAAHEQDGMIHFIVPGGLESRGRILKAVPGRCFACEYFGWTVRFDLRSDPARGGTDLEMTCCCVPPEDRVEVIAGWVSVLLAMKAAIDFGVDLRNHDPDRTWLQGYADN
jgi:uncharacterized protein YndB with AHSA1/START domain